MKRRNRSNPDTSLSSLYGMCGPGVLMGINSSGSWKQASGMLIDLADGGISD
jgi:hypothetical protein